MYFCCTGVVLRFIHFLTHKRIQKRWFACAHICSNNYLNRLIPCKSPVLIPTSLQILYLLNTLNGIRTVIQRIKYLPNLFLIPFAIYRWELCKNLFSLILIFVCTDKYTINDQAVSVCKKLKNSEFCLQYRFWIALQIEIPVLVIILIAKDFFYIKFQCLICPCVICRILADKVFQYIDIL